MQFVKALDIHSLTDNERAALQVGQWVYAGDKSAKGKFLGVTKGGSVVVAWHGSATRKGNKPNEYYRALRDYALAA
tara:strand:- start:190 stop:417 length:228 start_codon:yes stop_codon:yes gene_type:complete